MTARDRSYTLRRFDAMKFHPPTKTALGSAFSINQASGDLKDLEGKAKREPEPEGAHVTLAFAGQNPIIVSAAQIKELAAWVTANAAKIIVPAAIAP
jgi:hypothetical protein